MHDLATDLEKSGHFLPINSSVFKLDYLQHTREVKSKIKLIP